VHPAGRLPDCLVDGRPRQAAAPPAALWMRWAVTLRWPGHPVRGVAAIRVRPGRASTVGEHPTCGSSREKPKGRAALTRPSTTSPRRPLAASHLRVAPRGVASQRQAACTDLRSSRGREATLVPHRAACIRPAPPVYALCRLYTPCAACIRPAPPVYALCRLYTPCAACIRPAPPVYALCGLYCPYSRMPLVDHWPYSHWSPSTATRCPPIRPYAVLLQGCTLSPYRV
jgi:hypothetical protein